MAWARLAFGEFVNIRAGSNFVAFAGNLAGWGVYRLEIIWRRSSIPLWFGCLGIDLKQFSEKLKGWAKSLHHGGRQQGICYIGLPELVCICWGICSKCRLACVCFYFLEMCLDFFSFIRLSKLRLWLRWYTRCLARPIVPNLNFPCIFVFDPRTKLCLDVA